MTNAALINYLHTHGYLPLHGLQTLQRAKAYAAAHYGSGQAAKPASPNAGAAPTVGAQLAGNLRWNGHAPRHERGDWAEQLHRDHQPEDRRSTRARDADRPRRPQRADRPRQFNLSDPMVLWDPDTQRFYYNVWDVSARRWRGASARTPTPRASRGASATTRRASATPTTDLPDYPKLGQTKDFLLIGVNHYPRFTRMHADRVGRAVDRQAPGHSPDHDVSRRSSTFKTGHLQGPPEPGRHPGLHAGAGDPDRPVEHGLRHDDVGHRVPGHLRHGDQITVHAVKPKPERPDGSAAPG